MTTSTSTNQNSKHNTIQQLPSMIYILLQHTSAKKQEHKHNKAAIQIQNSYSSVVLLFFNDAAMTQHWCQFFLLCFKFQVTIFLSMDNREVAFRWHYHTRAAMMHVSVRGKKPWQTGKQDQLIRRTLQKSMCVMIYDSYRGGWGKTIKLQVLYDSNMIIV